MVKFWARTSLGSVWRPELWGEWSVVPGLKARGQPSSALSEAVEGGGWWRLGFITQGPSQVLVVPLAVETGSPGGEETGNPAGLGRDGASESAGGACRAGPTGTGLQIKKPTAARAWGCQSRK